MNSYLYAACRNFFISTSIGVSEGARSIICFLTRMSSLAVATCMVKRHTLHHFLTVDEQRALHSNCMRHLRIIAINTLDTMQ